MMARPRYALSDRRSRQLRGLLIAGVALVLAAGATVVAQTVRASSSCDPHRSLLEVVPTPDIAGSVTKIAQGVRDSEGCSEVRVRAASASDVLTSLGKSSAHPPDVWIPDSSLWVQRARTADLVTPADQESVASSPLVLAVPRAFRDSLPSGDAGQQWKDVLGALSAGQLALTLPGEAAAPSTAGILVTLKAAADQEPDPRAALTELLRTAAVDSGLGEGSSALSALSSPSAAVAVPEQAVAGAAVTAGAAPVAAVYPRSAGTPFDYPFTVLRADGHGRAVAGRLLAALRAPEGQALLRSDGFRGVDGAGDGLTADRGVDGTQPGTVAVPDVATADGLRQALDAIRRDARLLAVVDVSGSMAAQVPGYGGSTRLDLALRAAAAGLQLYPDSSEVGLWSFSEDVTGTSDYQELVPVAPLIGPAPGGREALALAMTGMRPVPDGGTGLYDTTLAAVRALRVGWDPARVNAVVLLTDGDDTDADGIGLDALLSTLRSEEQASGQPVPVITIAYGDGGGDGVASLQAISAATGGASYQASDPSRIRDIFLDAVGQRACRPDCQPATGN
jgi:Ca-activated chloride channel homolog